MTNKNCDKQPKVFIITGMPQSGKTTFLISIVEKLKGMGFTCGGFIAPGTFENGRRSSFDIIDLKTGQSKPLCSVHFRKGEKIGAFIFSDAGQNFGRELLKPAHLIKTDFVILDEIGPLELKGGGWASSLELLVQSGFSNQIWVVRKALVEDVKRKFNIPEATVLAIDVIAIEDAFIVISQSH